MKVGPRILRKAITMAIPQTTNDIAPIKSVTELIEARRVVALMIHEMSAYIEQATHAVDEPIIFYRAQSSWLPALTTNLTTSIGSSFGSNTNFGDTVDQMKDMGIV